MAKSIGKRGAVCVPNNQLTIADMYGEHVRPIPLDELFAPDIHPFRVQDEQMTLLVESVKRDGVREPGVARPLTDGGYELICGNRRKRACELEPVDTNIFL